MPNDTILGRSSAQVWTSIPFSAGSFTGNNSMTWTVAEGDVNAQRYLVQGKMMHLQFDIATTTVGGTPSTLLQFAMPGGFTIAFLPRTPIIVVDDSTAQLGFAEKVSNSLIGLGVNAGATANWSAATNTTRVQANFAIGLN